MSRYGRMRHHDPRRPLSGAHPWVVLLAVAVALGAAAGPADATTFSTPSRAVYCTTETATVAGPGVSCAVPSAGRPHAGPVPSTVWTYFEVRASGRAQAIVSDNFPNAGIVPVIPYGATWAAAGTRMIHHRISSSVNCTSRRTGLTCRNRSGHGFTLSRQRQRRF